MYGAKGPSLMRYLKNYATEFGIPTTKPMAMKGEVEESFTYQVHEGKFMLVTYKETPFMVEPGDRGWECPFCGGFLNGTVQLADHMLRKGCKKVFGEKEEKAEQDEEKKDE